MAFLAAALLSAGGALAASTNDDDSCDLALLPAATLLLPYFEVDLDRDRAKAKTTLFTITNVTRLPQIARVTISKWPRKRRAMFRRRRACVRRGGTA